MCTSVMPRASASRDASDDFVDRLFESVRVAFLGGEGAKLAGEDADVGVVDVAIEDVGGDVAVFPFPHRVAMIPSAFRSFER